MQGANEDFSIWGPWTGRKQADTLNDGMAVALYSFSESLFTSKENLKLGFSHQRWIYCAERMKTKLQAHRLHDPLGRMAVNGKHSVLGGEKPGGKQKSFCQWFPTHYIKKPAKGRPGLQVSSNLGIIFMLMNLYLFLKESVLILRLKDPQGKTVWRVLELMTLNPSSVSP